MVVVVLEQRHISETIKSQHYYKSSQTKNLDSNEKKGKQGWKEHSE